jgi:hypothetical protein
MKNKIIPVLFALVVFATNQASAYYSPSTGRWLSRDPIGEPGFEVLRASSTVPRPGQLVSTASLPPSRIFIRDMAILGKESNRYMFVANNPENYFDLLGLDIWVIRDKDGLIRHRVAVGNNADGTYWSSDFGPTSHSLCGRLNCRGIIGFYANQSSLVPTNLPSDYVIESHTVVDQGATDAARDYAKQRSDSADQPRYDCCGNNCIDWANGLANYAIGRQLREDLDKIKNEKSQSK